jgi:sister-chromatid-cohesion protein PDS5
VQKKLSALCSQGTPVQAKYAVRALQYVSKNAASSNGKLFKDLIAKLAEKKDVKQATVLRALAELCARAADKVQDEVVDVAQQVLLKTWKGGNVAELKCLAIALLRNYFLIRAEPTGKSKKNKKEEADSRAIKFIDQLFDLIEGDSALLSGAKDSDKSQVRAAAASAVLKLARQKRYDDLVTLERYQQLAQLIVTGESELCGEVLEKLYKGLRSLNQLPLRYLAYFALYGNDREHVVKAKKYFAACVQTRRQFLKQNQDQFVQEEPEDDDDEETRGKKTIPNAVKVIMRVMPEYSLPWTVHLLAHLPYFEEDSPSYTLTVKYLNMWMETVLRGSSTNAGNRSLVRQALVDIRQTNDAQDADNHNVHTVAELAYRILNEHYAITAVQDKQASMETFYLPQTLFTMPEKLLSLSQTFLPGDYHLPAGKNKFQQMLAESDKKKAKESDEEVSEEELHDKRQKNKKKTDDESESEALPKGKKRKAAEEREETESRPKNKKHKQAAEETPAKGKGKKNKTEEAEEVQDETRPKNKKNRKSEAVEEEDEPQPRTKGKKNKHEEQEETETKGKKGKKKAEPADEEPERVTNTKGKKGNKSKAEEDEAQESPRKGKKNKTEPEEEEEQDEPKPASKKQTKSKTADKKGKTAESAKADKTPNKKRKREVSEEEDQEEPEITHKRKQRKTSK